MKIIRVALLVMALACSTYAGEIPNGVPATAGDIPNNAPAAAGNIPNGVPVAAGDIPYGVPLLDLVLILL